MADREHETAVTAPADSPRHPSTCSCEDDVADWYRQYAPMLYGFILLRVQDPVVADDCTSDTFVRALNGRGSFRCNGQGPRPWLFTIARNLVHDWYKKARHRVEVLSDTVIEGLDCDADPLNQIVSAEERREVRRLVDDLPPAQSECLRRRFFEELSVRETAAAMRRAETAVRALQCRAVRNLAPAAVSR